jgi:hypothetical protein
MEQAQNQAESTVIRAGPTWNSRLKSSWKRFWLSASAQRLLESLNSYSIELDYVTHLAQGKLPNSEWVATATASLNEAKKALKEGDEDRGWRCLLESQRMELQGWQVVNPAEFQVRSETIYHEALNKLKSWRKERVKGISLADQETLSLEAVCEVTRILHEHFDNEAIKRRAAIKQMQLLVCVALVVLLLWLALVFLLPEFRFDLKHVPQVGSAALTATVMLFGTMGASLSGILSTSSDPGRVKIPDLFHSFRATLARLVVGALSALTSSVMLMSGFLNIGKMDTTTGVILSVALAAGFSERLVVSALSKAAGEKVREEKLPPYSEHWEDLTGGSTRGSSRQIRRPPDGGASPT